MENSTRRLPPPRSRCQPVFMKPPLCLLAPLILCLALALPAANPPTVVFISGEDEYHSAETLPAFARFLETNLVLKSIYLERKTQPDRIEGLEVLEQADLVVVFARRMTLPEAQLNRLQNFFNSGKPVIGLRTASHAFQNWLVFDKQVLGGNYVTTMAMN